MHGLHRPRSALAPIAAVLVLAGCGSDGPEQAENRPARSETGASAQGRPKQGVAPRPQRRPSSRPKRSPSVRMASARGPYKPGGLRAIAAALERKLGSAPRVREIMLGDNFAWFDVIDPGTPDGVRSYRWMGGSWENEPSRLTEPDRQGLQDAIFSLDEIDLEAAARLKVKGDSVDIADPETATMIIRRDEPFHHRIQWRVNVSGPHATRVLIADANGRDVDTQ